MTDAQRPADPPLNGPGPYLPQSPQGAAGPPPKGGTVRLVFGIIIALIGAPSLIRGLSLMLLSVVNPPAVPDGPAFGFGVFLAGALVTATGILLIVSGAKRNKAKRLALHPPNLYPSGPYLPNQYAPGQYDPNQHASGTAAPDQYNQNPSAPNPDQWGQGQRDPDQQPQDQMPQDPRQAPPR